MAKKSSNVPLIAAAAAGVAFFFFRKKKANAADLPTPQEPDPDDPTPTPSPSPVPGPPKSSKKDAPSWPFPGLSKSPGEDQEVTRLYNDWMGVIGDTIGDLGTGAVTPAVLAEARKRVGVPKGQKVYNFLADDTLADQYGFDGKIPNPSKRGKGWKQYIDAWIRLRNNYRNREHTDA